MTTSMAQRWTAQQVEAVAPDAASLTAARRLGGRWSGCGASEELVWGLCGGSGARQYEVVVDPAVPAYHCTCPSRKIPCKHVLSLLLLWAAGEVGPGAPAQFAAAWHAQRQQRAEKPAAAKKAPSAAAIAKREARIADGMAELDLWLRDQVRVGLAATKPGPREHERQAKRLVDAGAPGAAQMLRDLGRATDTATVLPAYGRLHLLARAFAGLDQLDAGLAANVRRHVGIPQRAADALAAPGVADVWMAVGTRIEPAGNIMSRRTYLWGTQTKRFALLLGSGTKSAPPQVPVAVGRAYHGTVHFFAGAPALRAVLGEGFEGDAAGSGTEFGSASGRTLDEMQAAFVDGLAADPWLERWPAVVTNMVLAHENREWWLVDADHRAVAAEGVEGADLTFWLAETGGHPATFAGEFDGAKLTLLSVLSAQPREAPLVGASQ